MCYICQAINKNNDIMKISVFILICAALLLGSCGKKKRSIDATPEEMAQVDSALKAKEAAMTPHEKLEKDMASHFVGAHIAYSGQDSVTFILNLNRQDGKLSNVKEYFKSSVDFVNYAFEKDSSLKTVITAGFVKLLDVPSAKNDLAIRHAWTRSKYNKVGRSSLEVNPLTKEVAKIVTGSFMHVYYTQNKDVVGFLASDFTKSDL